MNPRHFNWIQVAVCAGLLALLAAAGGCRRGEPASAAVPLATGDLASIAAEENAVLRVHRLSLWVGGQDAAALAKAIKEAPPDLQGELMWLAGLRLAQLYPNENAEARGRRLFGSEEGVSTAHGDRPQTTQEKLLELARTDPEKALELAMKSKLHPNEADELKAEILTQLGETDPERAFALMQARRDVNRARVGSQIAESWGKRDPEAALRWLEKQPPTYAMRQLTLSVLEGWARVDVSAAMEKAATLPVGPENEYVIRQIAEKWMKDDPALAAEWVRKQARLDPVLVKAAISALSETHPQLAANIFTTQVAPGHQRSQVDEIVRGWVAKDADGCLAWLRTLPVGETRLAGLREAAERLAEKNPAAAMAVLKEWPADANPEQLVRGIAENLKDRQAAVALLSALPESATKAELLSRAIDRASEGDADKLLAIASGLPKGALQTELMSRVAYSKFNDDPAAGIAWIKTVTDRAQLSVLVERVAQQWAEADLGSAADYVKTMEKGEGYERLLSMVSNRLSKKDPLEAVNWSVTLPDTQPARYAVGRTFAELAKYQPDKALQLMTALPAGPYRESALIYSVSSLAESKPGAGVELVTRLAAEKNQADYARRLSEVWSKNDLPASLAWVSGLSAGEVRDGAISGVAKNAAGTDPSQALTLAASITKDTRKLQAIQAVLDVWYVQNPTSALAALSGLSLPEEKRAELGKRLRGEK